MNTKKRRGINVAKTGRARDFLRENVRQRMERRYAHEPNLTAKITALHRESGVGKTTIQRLLDPETYGPYAATVDKIDAIARALRCEAFELLKDPATEDRG